MAATAITDKFVELKPTWVGKVGAGGVASAGATVVPASSVTGLTNGNVYYITVNRTDPTGTRKNAITARETFKGKLSGTDFIECVRGVEGVAQAWEADTVLEILVTAAGYNEIIEGILVEHNEDGTHKQIINMDTGTANAYIVTYALAPAEYTTGMEVLFIAGNDNTTAATINVNDLGAKTIKRYGTVDVQGGDIRAGQAITVVYDGTNFILKGFTNSITESNSYFAFPDGYLINGKIVPTVAGNNLTVAIKTLGGIDPSADSPVKVRINSDTYRTITSALSVTINAGTNWFNAGSAELASKEIDYFVYLCWNTAADPDGVSIMVSRIPYGTLISDFSGTTTNDKHIAISAAATATDSVVVIGRFAATLSGGAGYNWTVPTFTSKNLIQRPIYETRFLNWQYALSATASMTATLTGTDTNRYKIVGDKVYAEMAYLATLGGTPSYGIINTMPISRGRAVNGMPIGTVYVGDSASTGMGIWDWNNTQLNSAVVMKYVGNFASGGMTLYGANGWYSI